MDGVPELFDYVRDIQPILNKHCVSCHNYEKAAGKLLLVGDMTASYSVSYQQMTWPRVTQRRRSDRLAGVGPTLKAYGTASGASYLMQVLLAGHHEVQLTDLEMEMLARWIDAGSTFAGSYAALGSVSRDNKITVAKDDPVRPVLQQRCVVCHKGRGKALWLEGENKGEAHRYNVTHPDKSLLLLAPLAKQAGGLGWCEKNSRKRADAPEPPVFTSRDDPDFKALRTFVDQILEQYGQPRWFQEYFVYQDFYLREMKRFGALQENEDPYAIGPWKLDQRYFEQVYQVGPNPQ